MLFEENIYRFMYSALQEAEQAMEKEEVPVGAVVVFQNKIIGRGYNQTEKLKDATAHAEMIALTSAANYLGDWRLNECDLFVTLEPCLMCTGAMLNSRINNLYFGAFDSKFGACGSLYNIPNEKKINHVTNVYSGIYSEESKSLLKQFFDMKRKEKNC